MARALLIVDPQSDFITGSLPVPGAEAAMNGLAAYLRENEGAYALKIITGDRHPLNHCSFEGNGGRWPVHCVADSPGAAVWPALLAAANDSAGPVHMLSKGCSPAREEYSIFQDEGARATIAALLREHGIEGVDICGLAGDVCVLNTLADGIRLYGNGFFRVLKEFSPSLDNGSRLSDFCAREAVCSR